MIDRPVAVISRDGDKRGKPTGGIFPCRLEGCRGLRVGVRWPDGKLTFPCTKGMQPEDGGVWRIL